MWNSRRIIVLQKTYTPLCISNFCLKVLFAFWWHKNGMVIKDYCSETFSINYILATLKISVTQWVRRWVQNQNTVLYLVILIWKFVFIFDYWLAIVFTCFSPKRDQCAIGEHLGGESQTHVYKLSHCILLTFCKKECNTFF